MFIVFVHTWRDRYISGLLFVFKALQQASSLLQGCERGQTGAPGACTAIHSAALSAGFFFWRMSNHSLRRLHDVCCSDHDGQTIRQVLQNWAGDLNIEVGEEFGVAMVLPLPFASLVSVGYWSWTGLPWLEKRAAAGCGYRIVPKLFVGLPRAPDTVYNAVDIDNEWSAVRFQAIADALRSIRCEREGEEAEAAFDSTVVDHIRWLQGKRDAMVLESCRCHRQIFDMEHIVSSVLASSFLRSASDLSDVLEQALRVCIKDTEVCAYFIEKLYVDRIAPSPTTLRRHRLTLHLGFCLWQQELNDALLAGAGPVTWRTVDSSPQGAYTSTI